MLAGGARSGAEWLGGRVSEERDAEVHGGLAEVRGGNPFNWFSALLRVATANLRVPLLFSPSQCPSR